MIPDEEAAKHGYIRVIDESGQEYGYSAERFFVLDVPEALAKALGAPSDTRVQRPNKALQLQPTSRTRRRGRTSRPSRPARG